jgi:pilus assembly protein Flp/PilA
VPKPDRAASRNSPLPTIPWHLAIDPRRTKRSAAQKQRSLAFSGRAGVGAIPALSPCTSRTLICGRLLFAGSRFLYRRIEMNQLRRMLKDSRGANFVEYMIIVGVVALLAIAAFTTFGSDVQNKITEEGGKVTGIQD